jgi:hypothetical protein
MKRGTWRADFSDDPDDLLPSRSAIISADNEDEAVDKAATQIATQCALNLFASLSEGIDGNEATRSSKRPWASPRGRALSSRARALTELCITDWLGGIEVAYGSKMAPECFVLRWLSDHATRK